MAVDSILRTKIV